MKNSVSTRSIQRGARILAILIIIAVTAAVFAACTEDSDCEDSDYDEGIAEIVPEAETAILPDGSARIQTRLPSYDWGGYALRVLTQDVSDFVGGGGDTTWNVRDMEAEELTGEPLNDAVFRRNLALEERYNFKIRQIMVGTELSTNTVRNAVLAGSNDFDVVSFWVNSTAWMVEEGLLVDLLSVNYLDFTQPWWDGGMVESLTLLGKLPFVSGDLLIINRDAIAAILFNKQLIADLGLDCPYELVRGGQWTLDTFQNMARAAAADLSGHGGRLRMDTDRFGLLLGPVCALWRPMMSGVGVRMAEIGSDGTPFFTIDNERSINALLAIGDMLRADFIPRMAVGYSIFTEGRSLFMEATIRSVEGFRGTDIDFGILPLPKFDEHQQEWGHIVGNFNGRVISIPRFHDDDYLGRIGFMLEAIAAESRYTTIPVHHEIQLLGKYVRDDESSEMLDIIFGSVIWDPGLAYVSWAQGFQVLGSLVQGTLVSDWERRFGMAEAAMRATVNAFERWDY